MCHEARLFLKDCNTKTSLKTSKAKSNETIENASSLTQIKQLSCAHSCPRDHSAQVMLSEFKTIVTNALTQSLHKQASNNESKGNDKISKSSAHVHQIAQDTSATLDATASKTINLSITVHKEVAQHCLLLDQQV